MPDNERRDLFFTNVVRQLRTDFLARPNGTEPRKRHTYSYRLVRHSHWVCGSRRPGTLPENQLGELGPHCTRFTKNILARAALGPGFVSAPRPRVDLVPLSRAQGANNPGNHLPAVAADVLRLAGATGTAHPS